MGIGMLALFEADFKGLISADTKDVSTSSFMPHFALIK